MQISVQILYCSCHTVSTSQHLRSALQNYSGADYTPLSLPLTSTFRVQPFRTSGDIEPVESNRIRLFQILETWLHVENIAEV